MGVVETVVGHGTSQDVADRCSSQEFLKECLQRTPGLDAELLQDVLDACDMNELTALLLGSGGLSEADAADKLFLTKDEAKSVLIICRRFCLKEGVNFGDGSVYSPEPGDDAPPAAPPAAPAGGSPSNRRISMDRVSGGAAPQAAAPAPAAPAAPAPAPAAAAVKQQHEKPAAHQQQPSKGASGLPHAEQHHGHHAAHHHHAAPPAKPKAAAHAPAPAAPAPAAPASSPAPASTPAAAAASPSKTPSGGLMGPKGVPTPKPKSGPPPLPPPPASPHSDKPAAATPVATPPPAAAEGPKKPRPTTAPPTGRTPAAAASPDTAHTPSTSSQPAAAHAASASKPSGIPKPRPQSATPSSTAKSGPAPTYARPTKAYAARLKEDEAGASTSEGPVHGSKSVGTGTRKPLSPGSDQPKTTVFAHISSSLLRPTKAFMAWAAGNSKEEREERRMMSQSQKLSKSTTRPVSGTKPAPFSLSQRVKTTSVQLTTEEMQLLKAKEESGGSFRARPVPRSVHDGPATSTKSASAGGAPRSRSSLGGGASSTTPMSKPTRPASARTPSATASKDAAGSADANGSATPNSSAVPS